MNKQLVSIAMCTYNGEKFIRGQIESILSQAYTNLELIITDDCSTDKTISIIQEYEKKDSRIKLYKNINNLGFLKNFEYAISLCSGDFIALADQDDIWKKAKLEIFVKEIKDNVLIYSDAIIIDKDSNEIGFELIRPVDNLSKGKCNKAFLLTNFVSGNTLMFKKELLEHVLPIPKGMSYHDIWIAFVASTYGSIIYTDEALVYYRRYAEQVTNIAKKKPKNIFEKLEQKKEHRIKVANAKVKDLEILKSLSILKDEETIALIDSLIFHFQNYQNIYFNFNLFKLLNKYKNEIFISVPEKKVNKKVFRNSMGLKLRTSTFFIL